MTRREKERKIKMFGMIGMSLLVIASLATATYAWFTKIVATVNTGTMTVEAPDEYSFYSYNGNIDGSFDPTGTFADDFTMVTSSNKAAHTVFTNSKATYPGQSKIYCLYVDSRTKAVSLKLNRFISNDSAKQGLSQARIDSDTDKRINIGQAIDITSMSSQDGTGYYNSSLETGWLVGVDPADGLTGDVFDPSIDVLNSGSYASPEIDLGSSPITIYEDTSTQSAWTKIYVFFRVYFSDATSTLYRETSVDQYNIPVTTGNRTFVADPTNGTSNCYAGLKFQLTALTFDF